MTKRSRRSAASLLAGLRRLIRRPKVQCGVWVPRAVVLVVAIGLVLLAMNAVRGEYEAAAPPAAAEPIAVAVTASRELSMANQRVDLENELSPVKLLSGVKTTVAVRDCRSARVTMTVTLDARWFAIAQRLERGMSARIESQATPRFPLGRRRDSEMLRERWAPQVFIALPQTVENVALEMASPVRSPPRFALRRFNRDWPNRRDYVVDLDPATGALVPLNDREQFGPRFNLTFDAPWLHERGKRSCYADVPAVIVNQTAPFSAATVPLFDPGISGSVFDSEITFDAPGYVLLADEANPPPNQMSGRSTWSCEADDVDRAFTLDRSACRALIPIEEREAEATSQSRLLMISTLLGVLVSAVFEFMFGGFGRVRTWLLSRYGSKV